MLRGLAVSLRDAVVLSQMHLPDRRWSLFISHRNLLDMGKSRLSKRREVEAAEELEKSSPAKAKKKKKAAKKKATTSRARKKKADTPARRRIVWVVYSSTMREEGRFLYHERDKAEEKLNTLLAKGKRRYFIQPIKEPLDAEGNPMIPDEEEPKKPVKAAPAPEADADSEVDADADDEVDADVEPVEADAASDDD
ncbi:hypothetical protein Fuma_02419 [Fuerstiella marisgermanici]|uniref:Uncharacterized protein n=2 Tax=Fuerstiella marisgermanici TaxID=1891926 RepID=A0A1P8WFJ6_9PLAN|nr:hypothetical protein Fuma_02419 [Fuerstiella marisgermanici]